MNAEMKFDFPRKRYWRVEEFQLLVEANAFVDDAKTELIGGEVVYMNAQYLQHAFVKSELAFRLRLALAALDSPLLPIVEVAVSMPPSDVPEPDIVLTTMTSGRRFVDVATVALLIEIADTTRSFDLGDKAALYARHAVPEYWVVDIQRGEIVRHAEPQAGRYMIIDRVAIGSALSSVTIAGLAVETKGLESDATH